MIGFVAGQHFKLSLKRTEKIRRKLRNLARGIWRRSLTFISNHRILSRIFSTLDADFVRRKRHTSYDSIWDGYVVKSFPKVQSAQPYAETQLEQWRVLNTKDEGYDWPGDEWGDHETATRLFDGSLTASLGNEASLLCELGAGAGRYTIIALKRFPEASVLSFDVSIEFEKALRQRCESYINSNRLQTYLLDSHPQTLIRTIKQEGLLGKIDGLYSFDAMVHVDLHTLFIYWASAAKILRPGGVLAMSVADPCNDNGFMKLLYDAPSVYRQRGNAGMHFMWISQEIVECTLSRFGFDVTFSKGNGRDLFFSAKLVDPQRGNEWFEKVGATWGNI